MPMRFDATLKDLGRDYPPAFLSAFDKPPTERVSLLNVDLSAITTAGDLIYGIGDPLKEIVHLDFQSRASRTKHMDVMVYNVLLHREYEVPVHSIVLLLRPEATHYNLNGKIVYEARAGKSKMDFGYEVIPLWTYPADQLLAGELGTLPLAPLGKLPEGLTLEEGLAGVVHRLIERVLREASVDQARKLLTSAFLLTGLRVQRDVVRQLFEGVKAMHESDTYLAILDEGRVAEAKKILLLLGEDKFGPPDEASKTSLEGLEDLERLELLSRRLIKASSWQELLATP